MRQKSEPEGRENSLWEYSLGCQDVTWQTRTRASITMVNAKGDEEEEDEDVEDYPSTEA